MITNKNEICKNKVVVVGADHENTLGIIRGLGEMGIYPYVVLINDQNAIHFVLKSKYITKYWVANPNDIIDVLINNFSDEEFKTVLIPANDVASKITDVNLDLIKPYFITQNINNTSNSITKMMQKDTMAELAVKAGLLVPITKCLEVSECIEENLLVLDELLSKFPLIIKPLRSADGNRGFMNIVQNIKELNIALNERIGSNVLVQEFIEKDEEYDIQGVSCINSKKVVILGIIKKIRMLSGASLGTTSYGKIVCDVEGLNEEKLVRFIELTNYRGIFNFEVYRKGPKFYFGEINYRNSACGYAYRKYGYNSPYLFYMDTIGEDINVSNETEKKEDLYFIKDLSDFGQVRQGNVSLLQWLREFITADIHSVYNLRDIKPFTFQLKETVFSKVRKHLVIKNSF